MEHKAMDEAARTAFAETFYSRQTVLRELGTAGQKKLAKARVAVVGVGGLGSVSSLYLTLAGVGYIRVIDQDTLEPHNLHRQILYTPDDLNYPKAEVAAKKLQKQNPLVQVEAASVNLNADNAEALLKGVDIVVDGLDNMPTRHIVNRACVKLKKPYVFGAAIGFEGNLSVFHPPKTGCLECLMPSGAGGGMDTCDTRGIVGATAGIIGSLQAIETIKLIAGIGEPLLGKLLVCDFTDMDFTVLPITENPQCPVCHGESKLAGGERLVWLCGKDTANINPEKPLKQSLEELYPKVKAHFEVRLKSQLAIMFAYRGCDVSLFSGGRMLIKGVSNEQAALTAYHDILEKLKARA
jgi:molybdopterin/thiamine biosynthesis adenylyltransferase